MLPTSAGTEFVIGVDGTRFYTVLRHFQGISVIFKKMEDFAIQLLSNISFTEIIIAKQDVLKVNRIVINQVEID